MLKPRADSVIRTGLSGVQARTNVVKNKFGDKKRVRRPADYAPENRGAEDRLDTREGPREGGRTGGNKQYIKGGGSQSGKGGGSGRLYQYRERGKGGRSTRDRDQGGSKTK